MSTRRAKVLYDFTAEDAKELAVNGESKLPFVVSSQALFLTIFCLFFVIVAIVVILIRG